MSSDPLLTAILDSLPVTVTSVDLEGTILFVNAAAARNLSGTRESVVGTSLYGYFPDHAAATRERIRQTVNRRQAQRFEAVVTLPDGRERAFDSHYCPAFDGAGNLIAVQIVAQDVTDLRRATAARSDGERLWDVVSDDLSMTARRIAAVLQNAPILIGVLDPDMTVRYLNRAPGLDLDEVIGSSPLRWVTGAGQLAVKEAFARVLESKQVSECRAQDVNGRMWFVRLAPLVHDGEVKQVLSCTLDITEQTRLQAQLWHKQKVESLGIMARGIAHDFNNLLTAIMGDTGLARRWLASGRDPTALLDTIDAASRRAADLCEQMLVYARRDHPGAVAGDLNVVIAEMARLTRAAVNARIQTVYDLCDGLPPTRCSGTQLGQVVLNLVNNAADAIGDAHGCITIATDAVVLAESPGAFVPEPPPPGRYVRLRVTDSGQGMDADTIPHIFDPFYSTRSTGHGLGLSVVLGIASSHGAAIAVESAPGAGTTMTVLFPVHESLGAGAGVDPGNPAWHCAGGTILVVDDEPAVRRMAAGVLGEAGYQVAEAEDGDAALAVLEAHPRPIRAVLLDVTMPRRDGYSTLRELRKNHPDLLVLLSSGKPTELPGDDPRLRLLPKPYTPAELLGAIAAGLRRTEVACSPRKNRMRARSKL